MFGQKRELNPKTQWQTHKSKPKNLEMDPPNCSQLEFFNKINSIKGQFFQIIMLEQLGIIRSHSGLNLSCYTKVNSKWITDLNVNLKSIKLLDKNTGENRDLGSGNT